MMRQAAILWFVAAWLAALVAAPVVVALVCAR